MKNAPVFAIVGHPNEGKSSVISTLTEDDSVVVSPYPGETIECQRFPVKVDDQTLLEFVDTPGFQNPRKILESMKSSGKTDLELLEWFFSEHGEVKEFHHDLELMKPLREGAGLIFVVDCSRPMVAADEAEMEILRLINPPRMAVINFKDDDREYMEQWKLSFRRHFNVIREFNAHRAGFRERIALLETLRAVHQDWEPAIDRAIRAFHRDWEYRKKRVAEMTVQYLDWALHFRVEKSFSRDSEAERLQKLAIEKYRRSIADRETSLFKEIRRLYRHHLYDFRLPEHSILQEDLFAEKTWQVLGLTQKQLLLVATGMGAGIGAALDVAASGLTFGIFTAAGALTAGGGSLLKGRELSRAHIQRIPLGGAKVIVGPNRNPQFPYVLLDRILHFYRMILSHSHGNRDQFETGQDHKGEFDQAKRRELSSLSSVFRDLMSDRLERREKASADLRAWISSRLSGQD